MVYRTAKQLETVSKDWIEQGLMSHSTHFRSFQRRWGDCGISRDCSRSQRIWFLLRPKWATGAVTNVPMLQKQFHLTSRHVSVKCESVQSWKLSYYKPIQLPYFYANYLLTTWINTSVCWFISFTETICTATLCDNLDDVHLELNGIGRRRVHQTKQCSKVFIAAVTQYQLLYNAETLSSTDVILHHSEHTTGASTLTEHTYTHTRRNTYRHIQNTPLNTHKNHSHRHTRGTFKEHTQSLRGR